MRKWEREYRKRAKRWNVEYAQLMNIKELMRRFGEFSLVALPDTPNEANEKAKTVRVERNDARRYKSHLAREARVAKLLARAK